MIQSDQEIENTGDFRKKLELKKSFCNTNTYVNAINDRRTDKKLKINSLIIAKSHDKLTRSDKYISLTYSFSFAN